MLLAVQKKIKSAPDFAGVYMMKSANGQIIYIGKAKSLKKRLSDYLAKDLPIKTVALMVKVRDIDYLICENENMAL
ncbi:MAG: nucleotide excision repair endonuclease, partial [Candidatus Omnitrophica bacterium]|nr:nucleotide excision repair endonuclease [Candidatus Omnitrophota bacterium]